MEHVRRREADEVKVPKLPAPAEIQDWLRRLEGCVVAAAASTDPNSIMQWIVKCRKPADDPDLAFGYEACPEVFRSLDSKLAVALKDRVREHTRMRDYASPSRTSTRRPAIPPPFWGGAGLSMRS